MAGTSVWGNAGSVATATGLAYRGPAQGLRVFVTISANHSAIFCAGVVVLSLDDFGFARVIINFQISEFFRKGKVDNKRQIAY